MSGRKDPPCACVKAALCFVSVPGLPAGLLGAGVEGGKSEAQGDCTNHIRLLLLTLTLPALTWVT